VLMLAGSSRTSAFCAPCRWNRRWFDEVDRVERPLKPRTASFCGRDIPAPYKRGWWTFIPWFILAFETPNLLGKFMPGWSFYGVYSSEASSSPVHDSFRAIILAVVVEFSCESGPMPPKLKTLFMTFSKTDRFYTPF
jgi:hypothetical protein